MQQDSKLKGLRDNLKHNSIYVCVSSNAWTDCIAGKVTAKSADIFFSIQSVVVYIFVLQEKSWSSK